MALSSPTFTGSGLNDLSAGGAYTGSTAAIFYVEIVSAGSPDTFRWKKDTDGTWSAALTMTTSAYTMSDGVTITFGAATGHTAGDKWEIATGGQKVFPQAYYDNRHSSTAPFPLALDGTKKFSVELAASGALAAGNDLVVHGVESGTYETIENEEIVSKIMTQERIFALVLHDNCQYTVTCIHSITGEVLWDDTEEFSTYADHDCTQYAVNMAIDNDYLCVFGLLEARTDDEIKHSPFWCVRYDMQGSRIDSASFEPFAAPEGYPVLYDMYCNTMAVVQGGKVFLQAVTQHVGSIDDALTESTQKTTPGWVDTGNTRHWSACDTAQELPGDTIANWGGGAQVEYLTPAKYTRQIAKDIAIWHDMYSIYCYDLSTGAARWKHVIPGIQTKNFYPQEVALENAADSWVSLTGGGVAAIELGEGFVIALVTKTSYDLHNNFLADRLGTGDYEEFRVYPTYDYIKHYAYFLDYSGNFLGEILLREETFESYGDVGYPAGPRYGTGYMGNDMTAIPPTADMAGHEATLYDIIVRDPFYDIGTPPGPIGYLDGEGNYVDVWLYEAVYYYEVEGENSRSITDSITTRTSWSGITLSQESGVWYAYITCTGTESTETSTYRINCATRALISEIGGSFSPQPCPTFGTLPTVYKHLTWAENVTDPENPYTLRLEPGIGNADFWIHNGATSCMFSGDVYRYLSLFTWEGTEYLWAKKYVVDTWQTAVIEIDPTDCDVENEWLNAGTVTTYLADYEKLIGDTTYRVLLSDTWKAVTWNPDDGIEALWDVPFTHSAGGFKTDNTYSYFWDATNNVVTQRRNSDGAFVATLSISDQEWTAAPAMTRTKFINVAQSGESIVVKLVDKHGGQYQNHLIKWDLGVATGQSYSREQAAFVPRDLVATDELLIMLVVDAIHAYSHTGTEEWTAEGEFVLGGVYKTGADEYIYLLINDLRTVRKYSVGGSWLDTLTLPYALSAPGGLCIYEWETGVPDEKIPVLVFAGQGWLVSIADGSSDPDVCWSTYQGEPVQGVLYDPGHDAAALIYQTGSTVVSVGADGTEGSTYTDLDGVMPQGAPAGGGLYYYTYGFDDVSGEARLIALKSGYSLFDVVSITPADEATEVTRAIQPSVTFTQQPKLDTITSSTVSLKKVSDSSEVAYTILSCADRVLTIVPEKALAALTEYSLTLTTSITALDDTALSEEHVYTFTTGNDLPALEVVSTTPAADAVDVAYTTGSLSATFDADIDEATLTGQVTLSPSLDFTASASGAVLTITLTGTGFDSGTEYTVTLGTGILSTEAAAMEAAYTWSFTTAEQSFPPLPDDPEEWQYEIGEAYIEQPDAAYAEQVDVVLRAPRIESTSGKHPPKWRLQFKVDTYYEQNTGTEEEPVWERVLIESVSSADAPASFTYSADQGVTWRALPADGLPPEQYESKVKCSINVGRYASVIIIPAFGAEPA